MGQVKVEGVTSTLNGCRDHCKRSLEVVEGLVGVVLPQSRTVPGRVNHKVSGDCSEDLRRKYVGCPLATSVMHPFSVPSTATSLSVGEANARMHRYVDASGALV